MLTLHPVTDPTKVEALKLSIESNGWVGVPLITFEGGDSLLTGTHRYTAARELDWADYEIPTINIVDVFDEAGLDFAEVWYEECEDLVSVINRLSDDIIEKYGIDVH